MHMELTLNFVFEFYFLYSSTYVRAFSVKVLQSRGILVEDLGWHKETEGLKRLNFCWSFYGEYFNFFQNSKRKEN